MLHKGKLQAALNLKKGQFSIYDGSFSEQLEAYRLLLETLFRRYASSEQMERALPPPRHALSAGARPTIEFDRWLAGVDSADERVAPVYPFGRVFESHEHARQWAECIEGITTLAVDGSQLQPWRDASIPVALIQVGFFINPHRRRVPYTKDVRMEVLSPDEIATASKGEGTEPDGYPFSEMRVNLKRYLLEVETLREQMTQLARARQPGDPAHTPVVFFDGSLVVSFALTMPSPYREQYVEAAVSLLETSERLRVPLIGYVDTSYARDTITMLYRLDGASAQPTLRETKRIHDSLLWQGRLQWGDRTPAMLCARGDVLESYGEYRDRVAFCYLQTFSQRPPARLEFPRWLFEDNMLDAVLDVVRAEIIAGGQGYPYAIETADAVSVISMVDRAEFYAMFQDFIERQGQQFTFSTKATSKGRRR